MDLPEEFFKPFLDDDYQSKKYTRERKAKNEPLINMQIFASKIFKKNV